MNAPDGYIRIALSEFLNKSAAVYFNRDDRTFVISLNDEIVTEPISIYQLDVIIHVLNDVKEMKGRFGAV